MKIIKLEYPLENLKEIRLRRPKVKDEIETKKLLDEGIPEAEVELLLFERLSGISKNILMELDAYDYRQLQDAYREMITKKK